MGTLRRLCKTCQVIVSVCPPFAAEDVADKVILYGFTGIYLDANAISPARVFRMRGKMEAAGIRFVDGGIIGGPAWKPGCTWLYLSGTHAGELVSLFSAGPLETSIISQNVGQASTLKMCFAAYTKGRVALLCGIMATAEKYQVREALEHQWSRNESDFAQQARNVTTGVTAKAWRFKGEMEEIAATFTVAGLPGGFHEAAAEIYRRISSFKDVPQTPSLQEVLHSLSHE